MPELESAAGRGGRRQFLFVLYAIILHDRSASNSVINCNSNLVWDDFDFHDPGIIQSGNAAGRLGEEKHDQAGSQSTTGAIGSMARGRHADQLALRAGLKAS